MEQLDSVKTGQLYPYLKSTDVLMCPGDRVDAPFYERQMLISSYIWNGAVSSYDISSIKTRKLSQFKPTAILQWESDETSPISFNDGGNFPNEGFTRRHGGNRDGDPTQDSRSQVTVGMFDGSAKRMSARELYRLSGGLAPGGTGPPADMRTCPMTFGAIRPILGGNEHFLNPAGRALRRFGAVNFTPGVFRFPTGQGTSVHAPPSVGMFSVELAVARHRRVAVIRGQREGVLGTNFHAVAAADAQQPVDGPFLLRAIHHQRAGGHFFAQTVQ